MRKCEKLIQSFIASVSPSFLTRHFIISELDDMTRFFKRSGSRLSSKSGPPEEEPGTSTMKHTNTALFADVMEGSTNTRVDPRACIPLTAVRQVVRSGVLRLKSIFSGNIKSAQCREQDETNGIDGFISGSDNAIVVELTGSFQRHIIDFFKTIRGPQGDFLSDSEAKEKSECRSVWYGVVDGMHRLTAIQELMDENPERWDSFMWPVTILKGGHSIQVLKQLGRHQNRKHDATLYVETTFYDILSGMKEEAHRMQSMTSKPPTAKQVAAAYDGCSHLKDNTVRQTAATALRLPVRVIEEIGTIMNSEHPDLAEPPSSNSMALKTRRKGTNTPMTSVDCRVYRKFVNLTSLKSATKFMNASGTDAEEVQVHTLYRLRGISRLNKFKPVSYKDTLQQYEYTCAAMKEARKFEVLHEGQVWPKGMESIKQNLLRSSKFDTDVMENMGNDYNILDALLKQYRKVCPQIAPMKEKKYRESHRKDPDPDSFCQEIGKTAADNENADTRDAKEEKQKDVSKEDSVPQLGSEICDEDIVSVPKMSQITQESVQDEVDASEKVITGPKTSIPVDRMITENDVSASPSINSDRLNLHSKRGSSGTNEPERKDYVLEMGITCYQMKWQDFDKEIWTDEYPLQDLVLTDPPYGTPNSKSLRNTAYNNFISDKEINALCQFARRALKPGGWFFCFVSFRNFPAFLHELRNVGFDGPEYPFVFMKDTNTVQAHRGDMFPQNACEFAVVARAPGHRKDGFKPDLRSQYHLVPTETKRKFAAMSRIPVSKDKLLTPGTKSPVLTEEKHIGMLSEIINTFCPERGSVIDVYGGTLTTAIAAMKTARSCVVVEASTKIFRLAHERLRSIADALYHNDLRSRIGSKKRRTGNHAEDGVLLSQPKICSLQKKGKDDNTNAGKSTIEGIERVLKGGDSVELYILDQVVGKASLLCAGTSDERFQTTIHNVPLANFQGEDQKLVSCYMFEPNECCLDCPYPYKYGGIEPPPGTLKGLNGIFAWDLNKMRSLS